ncbi:MAG: PIN domain-containing protein, partial [Chloroflexi bacterium]
LYREIVDLVRDTLGSLNFHDALIALECRNLGIPWIATFDNDFDHISWLERLSSPADVVSSR